MIRIYRHVCLRPAWGLAAFSALVMCSWFSRAPGQAPRSVDLEATEATADSSLAREGTELDSVPGHFTVDDDRLTFHSADRRWDVHALENLALERVAQTMAEAQTELQWTVDGRITEFRGANYLLLSRAMVRRNTAGSQRSF